MMAEAVGTEKIQMATSLITELKSIKSETGWKDLGNLISEMEQHPPVILLG